MKDYLKFIKENPRYEKAVGKSYSPDEYFEEMAKHANRNDRLANAYVPLTVEDIVNIYKNCL